MVYEVVTLEDHEYIRFHCTSRRKAQKYANGRKPFPYTIYVLDQWGMGQ